MIFPELRFDNANNSAISLSVLSEHARRGNVRVISQGVDGTGKLRLTIDLPGSRTVVNRGPVR